MTWKRSIPDGDLTWYRTIVYTYDRQGNKVEEAYGQQEVARDGEPQSWHRIYFAYDRNSHLVSVKDDFGAEVTYDYDCLGNVTWEERVIEEGVHSIIHYAYNKNGWLVQKTEEIQGNGSVRRAVTGYGHDANGNLNQVSYDLDSWGRITGIGFADGGREGYEYTPAYRP